MAAKRRSTKRSSKAVSVQPLASSFPNEGYDREMQITVKVAEGTLPLSKTLTVTHLGMREPFLQQDGTEFLDSTNQSFGVLKE
jgi:hypothetical protein